jgi:hypothetical protein
MEVARDSWVRVKSGLYKDDLGKVGGFEGLRTQIGV